MAALLALSACTGALDTGPAPGPAQPGDAAATATATPPAPAPRAAAGGRTVASLGTPAEPGLWLKTPLVQRSAKGRVTDLATGRSLAVDLIPLAGPAGAGSRMSLAAYQALSLPLTALPELQVSVP